MTHVATANARSESSRPSRRQMLRAAGVVLALPWLESLERIGARADDASDAASPGPDDGPPRRLVVLCTPLGLHPPSFFPEQSGRDYALSPYLEPLAALRNDFTVISGLAHPDVGPSHDSLFSFLTAAPHPELRAGFRNSISVDQFAAEQIGERTRFPSLSLSAEGFGLSWTRSGALVPPDLYPASLFARLFLEGKPEEVERQRRRLADGRSILDALRAPARELAPQVGRRDQEKLDEYYTSVRELERKLAVAESWSRRPKPQVDAQPPQNNMNPADLIGKTRLMCDLIHLAIQTDSTRLITMLLLGTSLVPPIPGVSLGHHDLSHHGQDPGKIEQLRKVELAKMHVVAELLGKLKETREGDGSLLDRTAVLFSSNLGNASNHATRNLPVLLAGGGFRHGQHLAFDADQGPPLCNLYVTLLRRLGIDADQFGSSTGTLAGLEGG